MRLLLTSGGIKNPSIEQALVDLLGRPVSECSALCIPSAAYAMGDVGAREAWRMIAGVSGSPLCEIGWKSLGVLELSALESVGEDRWVPLVEGTDALLVGGGDPLYLAYWMRRSGLARLFDSLQGAVYVGVSAGSMVMAPRIGEDFVRWKPPTGGDETLGLVDFAIFPHLDHEMMPGNSMPDAQRWAESVPLPAYAIDDETAIKVVDGALEVVSEGHWRHFGR